MYEYWTVVAGDSLLQTTSWFPSRADWLRGARGGFLFLGCVLSLLYSDRRRIWLSSSLWP